MSFRTLITGGAGFIGSHLAERLLKEGDQVTILDNLSTGLYTNIAHLEGNKSFTAIIDTALNDGLVEKLISKNDRVFHLASAVGVKLIMEQPVRTIETIFGATDIVLRYCSRYRRPILITSTSEVYGKGVCVPFAEDDDVLTGATSKHRWAYACAKALDEFLALAHWRETQIPVVIARLFNTVGPRQSGQYGMVVPRFVRAALEDKPIIIYGDGEQKRCFSHVLDVVEGLVNMIARPTCYGQVINIGNDEEISINELALVISEMTNTLGKIIHIPYSEAYGDGFEDMLRRKPNLEKARRLIDYKPTRNLKTIIEDIILSLNGGVSLSDRNQ